MLGADERCQFAFWRHFFLNQRRLSLAAFYVRWFFFFFCIRRFISYKIVDWNCVRIGGNLEATDWQRWPMNYSHHMSLHRTSAALVSIMSSRAVLEQFWSNLRAVLEQFLSSFREVSKQFQISFRAISEQFQSNFRAVFSHRWRHHQFLIIDSSKWIPEQF